ncbi:protein amalgam [Biomphalaria pfeifferi]|uniref:Protein amalgam n=1 Tax=Biomphalaria pfeifferi TaxID=112525 RepID=A0AAD8C7L9_BIOPF|nr:protein amalgam [Biomphalaria pfeifferi]
MAWIHFCLVSFMYFSFVRCQDPEIVNDILPEVKRVGQTAMMNCTVARLGDNSVRWVFDGNIHQVISSNEEIIVMNPWKGGVPTYRVLRLPQGDRVTFVLLISRIRPEFSGKYICSVMVHNQAVDHWTTKTGYLTVLQPPMIRPGSTDSVKMVDKGGNTSITCDAYGVPYPNITWVRSDGKLLPNGKAMFRGRTLPILSADVKYSGVYKCVADNFIKPPAEALTQVYVFQEPTVRVLQNSVGQYANGRLDAKLDCIVRGYPTPTVYWMVKNGDQKVILTDSDKYETTKQATDTQNLLNGEQWYTLKIRYIQALDYRDYYCVGVNSIGEGNATVNVFSTWDCQGPLCYSLDPSRPNSANFPQSAPLCILLFSTLLFLVT